MMKLLVSFLFFVIIISSIFSAGKRDNNNSHPLPAESIESVNSIEQPNADMENMIKLTGRIQIYGNEPHTFTGIIDENGIEYAIYPSEQEEKLRTLQGQLIEFTVILLDESQGYGSLFLKGGTVTPLEWNIIR
jgi:hypothetical protein